MEVSYVSVGTDYTNILINCHVWTQFLAQYLLDALVSYHTIDVRNYEELVATEQIFFCLFDSSQIDVAVTY